MKLGDLFAIRCYIVGVKFGYNKWFVARTGYPGQFQNLLPASKSG